MATNSPLRVKQGSKQLIIEGVDSLGEATGSWQAVPLGTRRLLLQREGGLVTSLAPPPAPAEFSQVSRSTLHSLLQQFCREGWSGTLALDCGIAAKTLELRQGEIAFAGSSLLADRLGEVLYRQGSISLESLHHYGSLVGENTKFGQVLLNLHSFSPRQLWEALCLQVRHVVKSLFYPESCYLEIYPQTFSQANVISLDGSNSQFLAACYAFGSLLESFQQRLTPHTKLRLNGEFATATSNVNEDDTFWQEFLRILKANPQADTVSSQVRLPPSYTYAQILDYWQQEKLSIEGLRPPLATVRSELIPLKQQIQAYNLLVQAVQHHAGNENKALPLEVLSGLIGGIDQPGVSFRCLSPSGQIDTEAAVNLYCLAEASRATLPAMLKAVKKLQCFVVQLAYDLLSPAAHQKVREVFDQYSQR